MLRAATASAQRGRLFRSIQRKPSLRQKSSWVDRLRGLIGANESTKDNPEKQKNRPRIIDTDRSASSHDTASPSSSVPSKTMKDERHVNVLPAWNQDWSDEFPLQTKAEKRQQQLESTRRIVRIAAGRVLEPSAIALLGMSASLVLGIGAAEASLMVTDIPFVESTDAGMFVCRYALEQLLPSTVWSTQDANLIATAMGYDTTTFLKALDATNPKDASDLLTLRFCETLRSLSAGFMLLAQIVRIGAIGAQAPGIYEERVRTGKESPILVFGPKRTGIVIRLCGHESNITSLSLRRMRWRLFPVFEEPFNKVSHLISQFSHGYRIPVFWSIRPDRYGSSYSWKGFPVSRECLIRTSTGKNILILEADATNANDPLALGDQSLDLNIDDASQGFRRIEELFRKGVGTPFRTLKVYLGNSLEVSKSGGGHAYTLRHRVKYSKEVDVLIDSRGPILGEVLKWCERVTARNKSGRKIILVQTSSRQYFLSLKLLMERYGYEIRDPLDWHVLSELPNDEGDAKEDTDYTADGNSDHDKRRSLLGILTADQMESNTHTLQEVLKLTRVPRLVYYGKTAETVNAVQALVDAGGVDAGNCCALLDREGGTRFLEGSLGKDQMSLIQRGDATAAAVARRPKNGAEQYETSLRPHQSELVQQTPKPATTSSSNSKGPSSVTPGLHVICSAAIYDDLFRQVRQWTRMGYSAKDIQNELDGRYQAILQQSMEVHETVTEVTESEQKEEKGETITTPKESDEDGVGNNTDLHNDYIRSEAEDEEDVLSSGSANEEIEKA